MSIIYKRLIVCLDVKEGRVVKGTRFVDLKDQGDPAELASFYEAEGADEIVFLDVSATQEGRKTMFEVIEKTAEKLFIPLTVGGGIHNLDAVRTALRCGADKVAINSGAVANPHLLRQAADAAGSQCVVLSIDVRREKDLARVYVHGGKKPTDLDAVLWAKQGEAQGAGEILLTSIDRDGTRLGYDVELSDAICKAVSVPVILSGGAGKPSHIPEALLATQADAALVAGMLHDGSTRVSEIKDCMHRAGVFARGKEVAFKADAWKPCLSNDGKSQNEV